MDRARLTPLNSRYTTGFGQMFLFQTGRAEPCVHASFSTVGHDVTGLRRQEPIGFSDLVQLGQEWQGVD
jgi:hypothetical protein